MVKVINRDSYLNQLIAGQQNGLIKIVTGIRRCGKSFLLFELFHRYLTDHGTDESHIIEIALDDISNEQLRNPHLLLRYIKERIIDGELYYVLLDEIQLADRFEEVLNSLLRIKNVDVYVTGSVFSPRTSLQSSAVAETKFIFIRFRSLSSSLLAKEQSKMRGRNTTPTADFPLSYQWIQSRKKRHISGICMKVYIWQTS